MNVHKIILTIGFLFALSTAGMAKTIGFSVPLTGDFSELGEKFRKGVEIAAKALNTNARIVFVDDGCSAETAQRAAERLIAERVDIIAGFLCNDAAIVAATQVSEIGIPVIVSGARSVRLIKDREREAWNLWRMAPGDDYPVLAAAREISKTWREIPFALVDDGTIYGRNFTDQLRFQLDELGIKPQFSDSFRAAQSTQAGLLRRLKRSGVTSALVASATLEDLQTIAIDNARLEIDLDLMMTEAIAPLPFLETASELPAGIRAIGWPLRSVQELDERIRNEGFLPDQLIYDGYATLELALGAVAHSHEQTTNNLSSGSFDTILGTISFNEYGAAELNPYELLIWDGEQFHTQSNATSTQ